MIATLKAERRYVNKRIGELQRKKQYLDIQIAVVSAEKRVQVSQAKKRKIYPLVAECIAKGKSYPETARFLNVRGFRNGEKVWRGAAVQTIFEAGIK